MVLIYFNRSRQLKEEEKRNKLNKALQGDEFQALASDSAESSDEETRDKVSSFRHFKLPWVN